MRVSLPSLGLGILVLLASAVNAQDAEPECFTTEWVEGLIPCFLQKLIDLVELDENSTETNSFERDVGGSWTQHDERTHGQRSQMYSPLNGMYDFNEEIKSEMMRQLGVVRPRTMQEKHKLDVLKQLQKVDFNAVLDHTVDRAVSASIVAQRYAQTALQVGVQQGFIQDVSALDDRFEDVCRIAVPFIPGLNQPLCEVGLAILECLTQYSNTEYEHSLKWAKCIFECQDLPQVSQCVVDHFDGCGLSWPLTDVSWIGSMVVRGFVDYLELDHCVFEFEHPLNLTDTLVLEEGGNATTIAFRQYLPPSVHCINLGMLGSPIGIVAGMVQWFKGEIGDCDAKIEVTTHNYMNSLLSFYVEAYLPPSQETRLGTLSLGFPKCNDGSMLKQVAIGYHDHAVNQSGVIHLDASNWNETFYIPIMASIDTKPDGDYENELTIKLRAGTMLRENVKIPLIVRDRDVLSAEVGGNTMCSIVNDPHIVTFDHFYYSNHHEGHFYIYKHTEMDYSIQGVFQKCTRTMNATCLCGVSVRVGNEVFVVDQCRRVVDDDDVFHKFVNLYVTGEVTPGFQIFRKNGGTKFEVVLPGGLSARIVTLGKHLNLFIRPAVTDLDKTRGLCGTFNRDTSDDLMMQDGTVYTGEGSGERGQPKPFNRDWRVPEDEITFSGVERSENVKAHESASCSCMYVVIDGASCTCSGGNLVDTCDIMDDNTEDMTEEIAKITAASPKQLFKENGIVEFPNLEIDEEYDPPVFEWNPDGEFDSGSASTACENNELADGMLDSCRSRVGGLLNLNRRRVFERDRYGCEDDIMITDSLNWTTSFIEGAKERCRDYLYGDMLITTKHHQEFESESCPMQCNGRGSCDQGVCVCNGTYTGLACEDDTSLTPSVRLLTQLCDVRMENCSYVKLTGWNLLPEHQLSCYFIPMQMAVGGIPTEGSSTAIQKEASSITSQQVACELPEKSGSYEVELVSGAGAAIATTANIMNTKMTIISFDSVCYQCNPEGECTFRETDNHCLINGQCYASGEANPDDECYICTPNQLRDDWSLLPTVECHLKYEEWVQEEELAMRTRTIRIIIASVLSGTVALCAVIMFICFGSMKKEQDRLKTQYGLKAREITKLNAAVMKSVDSGVGVGPDIDMAEVSAYGYSSEAESPSPSTSVDVRSETYEEQDEQKEERHEPDQSEIKL